MATSSSSKNLSSLFLVESVGGGGAKQSYHAGCVIQRKLYLHGGISKKGSTVPMDDLYCLDLITGGWSQITAKNSPALSHHCALSLQDRYMLLIGGWNGKARGSDVYAYDTTDNRWLHPPTQGFPAGAGLSSHACVILSNGDILAIGREGGLRTQRRSGNAFMLHGDVKTAFSYTSYPLGASSRSGHSAHILGSNLVVYGGRGDNALEFHGGYKAHSTDHGQGFVDRVFSHCKDSSSSIKAMSKPPCGRKHHVALASHKHGGALVIHGGETFDGKSREEPVGDMYLLTFKPSVSWYKLGSTEFGRTGHVCAGLGETWFIHGGEGERGMVSAQTFKISVL